MVPAQIFPTADGWLTLFITHDKFWQKFCGEVGQPEWIDRPGVRHHGQPRATNRGRVLAAIGDVLKQRAAAEWVRRLAPLGRRRRRGRNAWRRRWTSELAAARELVVQLGDGEPPLRAVGSPIKFERLRAAYGLPPLLDEHRDEVLGKAAA